jgi:hypothetical protein
VVATCAINHPNARVLRSWREIPDLRGCVLFLDEITSQLPSRQSMSVPAQLVRTVNQLRKVDVEVVWTAPNWARADVVLREVTQEVTVCRGYVPDRWVREPVVPPWWRATSKRVRHDDGAPALRPSRWPANRLFRWKSYDAVAFDEFTYRAVKDVRPLSRLWYWRPWHDEQFLYDTGSGVELLDHIDEVGVCVACGGTRSRPKCRCGGLRGGSGVGPGGPEPVTAEIPAVIPVDGRSPHGPVDPSRRLGPARRSS